MKAMSTMPNEKIQKLEAMETSFGCHSLTREERAQRLLKHTLTVKPDPHPLDGMETRLDAHEEKRDEVRIFENQRNGTAVPEERDDCDSVQQVKT